MYQDTNITKSDKQRNPNSTTSSLGIHGKTSIQNYNNQIFWSYCTNTVVFKTLIIIGESPSLDINIKPINKIS